jgi:hypothetical protein
LAWQGTQLLFTHSSAELQVLQAFVIPHPRSTVPQLASGKSPHVLGWQQPPSAMHTSPVLQGRQLFLCPHPRSTGVQLVAAPPSSTSVHVLGVHDVQTLFTHVPPPAHGPHWMLPLPHALGTAPHAAPASVSAHSGGGVMQRPE